MSLHRVAVQRVARVLRRKGHAVVIHARRPKHTQPGDLHVDGTLWVAVRASTVQRRPHNVTVRGQFYRYFYDVEFYNLGLRGKRPDPAPDIWALVGPDRVHYLPASELHGLTITFLRGGRQPVRCAGRECRRCHDLVGVMVAPRKGQAA